jgi:hypothetical protein
MAMTEERLKCEAIDGSRGPSHLFRPLTVFAGGGLAMQTSIVQRRQPERHLELTSGGQELSGYQGPMRESWQTGALRWLVTQKILP